WQRAELGLEEDPESPIAEQIRFWRHELRDLPEVLRLPADRARPAIASGCGARHRFTVSAGTGAGLRELAERTGGTFFMALHAAFAVVLATLSGDRDIAIGTPVAGRGAAVLDDLVGMFVNTLVLRTEVPAASTFRELLVAVRDSDLRAFAHCDVPFERLVELVNPARSAARHPLFQVMLDLRQGPVSTPVLPGLHTETIELRSDTAKFDLHLTVAEQPDGTVGAEFEYATDLFDEPTIASLARRWQIVLDAVVAAPDQPVGTIDLLSGDERTQILEAWKDTAHAVPDTTLAELLRAQVGRSPGAVAMHYEGSEWTYVALAERVNRLARLLISIGVG
ncbi:MAG: condensation domain-containing protein, partial [Stackebrandtia sp.]